MPPVRLRPEALEELGEAWRWYEARRLGLGDEFGACVDAAMAEIGRAPSFCPKIRGNTRRKLLRRFPYALLYLAEPEHVEVIAVFHAARDPKQWAQRVGT